MLTKEEKQKQLRLYNQQLDSGELTQLNALTASELRRKYWKLQGKKCPVLNTVIDFKDSTCDHKHRKASDVYGGDEWLGLIRGILDFRANSWEGKCYRSYIKSGVHKFIGFSEALRNLANYLDNPTVPYGYVYPSEAPKIKREKLGVREYKKVIKYYSKVYKKSKVYPKHTKYKTKKWEKMIADTEAYIAQQQILKAENKAKKKNLKNPKKPKKYNKR